MTTHIAQFLTAFGGKGTKCNALIQFDMAADDGCFTDHDAGTVVNKEIFADGCTRMDVDTGFAVCLFRHHTRDKRNTKQKQLMRQTVYRDGIKSRIRKYDLVFAACSRIAIVSGLQIGL